MSEPTRAYPLDRPCKDCGQTPTRVVRFWVNGMRYRVCKTHATEYRLMRVLNLLRTTNPVTGDPTR